LENWLTSPFACESWTAQCCIHLQVFIGNLRMCTVQSASLRARIFDYFLEVILMLIHVQELLCIYYWMLNSIELNDSED